MEPFIFISGTRHVVVREKAWAEYEKFYRVNTQILHLAPWETFVGFFI